MDHGQQENAARQTYHQNLKNYLFSLFFGTILGWAFNIFQGVEMAPISTVLALIGLIGLNSLPRTYIGFYLFGVAFHTVSLYWVGHALYFAPYTIGINLDVFVPFASFAISLILALQFPLSLAIGRSYWILPFLLFDFGRSLSDTFFPWNFIGYTSVLWLSSLRFLGILGMTTYMLLLGHIRQLSRIFQLGLITLSCVMMMDHYLYQRQELISSSYTVKIVQTNITQDKKYTDDQMHNLMALSLKGEATSFIIWPESVVLKCLHHRPDICTMLAHIIPKDSYLILGHIRFDQNLYVSISALNHLGAIVSTYDKQHLVPFGEYTPFFIRLPKLTHGKDPYQQGVFKHMLNVTPSAAPLICYETAFPYLLKNYKKAEWIVGISNDAWFGKTNGPFQHFHLARCRAIEARKPFVRCVNSGISGLIGPNGRIICYIPFQKTDILVTPLFMKNAS